LVEEAFLQKAVKLEFIPKNNKFKRFAKLASLPKQLMRPTAVIAKLPYIAGGYSIVFIGGIDTRENFAYSIQNNAYRKLAALPVGHNIMTNVCVNFKDQAIFTFTHDANLYIKVAVMDLT
jgi:hypothetical protein